MVFLGGPHGGFHMLLCSYKVAMLFLCRCYKVFLVVDTVFPGGCQGVSRWLLFFGGF